MVMNVQIQWAVLCICMCVCVSKTLQKINSLAGRPFREETHLVNYAINLPKYAHVSELQRMACILAVSAADSIITAC